MKILYFVLGMITAFFDKAETLYFVQNIRSSWEARGMEKSYSEHQRKVLIDTLSKTKDTNLINRFYTTLMAFTLEAGRPQDSEQVLNVAGSELQSARSSLENLSL